MGKGRKKRNKGDTPSLEMTPMIDVVFQLLIFFIVTIKPKDILANLDALRPAPDPKPVEVKKDPITISIGPQGFFFQGSLMTEKQLSSSLQKIARLDPTTTIIVKCTGDSPHGFLVRALDTCNSVNLRNLSVFSM